MKQLIRGSTAAILAKYARVIASDEISPLRNFAPKLKRLVPLSGSSGTSFIASDGSAAGCAGTAVIFAPIRSYDGTGAGGLSRSP
jgi:hypothetical protein